MLRKTSLGAVLLLCTSSAFAFECSELTPWENQAVYNGGDQVQYNQNAYEANWWTKDQNPETHSGQWQEWSLLGQCDQGDNQPPRVAINGPYRGQVNGELQFSSDGSEDNDGYIAEYHWDFGDGQESQQANPAHAYAQSGTYDVTLTVVDDNNVSTTASTHAIIGAGGECTLPTWDSSTVYHDGDRVQYKQVVYEANWWTKGQDPAAHSDQWMVWTRLEQCDTSSNQPPTAKIDASSSGMVGQALTFTGSQSTDSDGQIAQVLWRFGDGRSSDQLNATHSYASTGNYTVQLTVTDDDGATHTTSHSIAITNASNQSPVSVSNGPYEADAGATLAFSSAGSHDPDGQLATYEWDFGDGTTSSDANPSHTYSAAGTYPVTLTVTDNDGVSHTSTTQAVIEGEGQAHGNRVIGYFTNWGIYDRNYHVKNIHTSGSAEKLTHIVYAFGDVSDGECKVGDPFADYKKHYSAAESVDGKADSWEQGSLRGNFAQLRRLKEMYPDIKVLWSFGGWTWSDGFGEAAANPEEFAQSCHDLVFDSRWADVFDGIDIDWEYPNACGLSCDNSGFNAYRDLMKALRAEFGDKLVTSAIGAGESKINAANYGGAAQYVDFYMVMNYDYFGAWNKNGPTAPHSPLYEYDGIPDAAFNTDHSIQLLMDKGIPADKLLLGIGFYGRGWTGVSQSAPGGSASGPADGFEAGMEDYRVLKNSCPPTGTIAGTAYAHCGSDWWSYDTPETIATKMNYLEQHGLGGTFFWELGGDTSDGELIEAIDSNLD